MPVAESPKLELKKLLYTTIHDAMQLARSAGDMDLHRLINKVEKQVRLLEDGHQVTEDRYQRRVAELEQVLRNTARKKEEEHNERVGQLHTTIRDLTTANFNLSGKLKEAAAAEGSYRAREEMLLDKVKELEGVREQLAAVSDNQVKGIARLQERETRAAAALGEAEMQAAQYIAAKVRAEEERNRTEEERQKLAEMVSGMTERMAGLEDGLQQQRAAARALQASLDAHRQEKEHALQEVEVLREDSDRLRALLSDKDHGAQRGSAEAEEEREARRRMEGELEGEREKRKMLEEVLGKEREKRRGLEEQVERQRRGEEEAEEEREREERERKEGEGLRERWEDERRRRVEAEQEAQEERKSSELLRVQLKQLRRGSIERLAQGKAGGGEGTKCAGCSKELRQLRWYISTLPFPPLHANSQTG